MSVVVVGLLTLVLSVGSLTICAPFGLVPLVGGAAAIYTLLRRGSGVPRGPLERRLALVEDERREIAGTHGGASPRTDHVVTLRFFDGTKRELPVFDSTAELAPGTAGVAYLKGDTLVDFRCVEE